MIFGSLFKRDKAVRVTLKKKKKNTRKKRPSSKKTAAKKISKPAVKKRKPPAKKAKVRANKKAKKKGGKKPEPKKARKAGTLRGKRAGRKPKKTDSQKEILVGSITHYFPKVKAGVVKITKGRLGVGDKIRIRGNTTGFTQKIKSIQIDNEPVQYAQKPKAAGVLCKKRVRINDKVFKLGGE